MPTCYSIRNRPMGSYALLSWRLEASLDLVNWQTLDTRYNHLHSESTRNQMCQGGATNTWGIDMSVLGNLAG